MSELGPSDGETARADPVLLDWVGAFLGRFGRSIRLHYAIPSGPRCVMEFPEPTKAPDARQPS